MMKISLWLLWLLCTNATLHRCSAFQFSRKGAAATAGESGDRVVVLVTDHAEKAKHLKYKTISCSQLADLKASRANIALTDCTNIEDTIELEEFFESGGNVLFFKHEDGQIAMQDKFGLRIHKTDKPQWSKITSNSAAQVPIPKSGFKCDSFLSFDSANIVLFPVLSATGEYHLHGTEFSAKSLVVGAILRGSRSKAALSAWTASEMPQDVLSALIGWLNTPSNLEFDELKLISAEGQQLKIGAKEWNFETLGVQDLEFTLRVPRDFPKVDWSQTSALLTIIQFERILLRQQISPEVHTGKDGLELLTFKAKPSKLHWGSNQIYLSFYRQGMFNIKLEDTVRVRPHLLPDAEPFNWHHVHYYTFKVCFAAAFIMLAYAWMAEQTRVTVKEH